MSEIDNKLSKRISSLFAVGAIPSGFIALIGDFFTPKGGAIAVGMLGFIALMFLIYLITYLSANDGTGKKPWWFKLTTNDKDINWIWMPKSPFSSHGVHVLIIVVIVCFFSANKSLASANKSGYLAKNIDSITIAQQQLGISEKMLKEVEKTATQVTELNKKADNFKKETSDNAAKELANRGIEWKEDNLWHAVVREDVEVVDLFMKGGFVPTSYTGSIVQRAIMSNNQELITSLAGGKLKHLNTSFINDKQCSDFIGEYVNAGQEIKKEGNTYTSVPTGDGAKYGKLSEVIMNALSQKNSSMRILLKKVCASEDFLKEVNGKNEAAQSNLKTKQSSENIRMADYWASVLKLLS
jgi:hypothetical protein